MDCPLACLLEWAEGCQAQDNRQEGQRHHLDTTQSPQELSYLSRAWSMPPIATVIEVS